VTGADVRQLTLPSRLWSLAVEAVFPPRCVTCRAWGAFVCATCSAQLVRAEHSRCGVCWQPSADTRCETCRHTSPAFTAVRAVYDYSGPARDLVHALKFGGVSAVAPEMAAPMAELLHSWQPEVSAIVPVPMAGVRRRRRGYNQAELLARDVSRSTAIPLATGAVVRSSGPAQVDQPDADSRRRNVRGAFRPGRTRVTGDVLLLDDVSTTGATMDACARALRAAGADRVYGLTFARES
jgi:ComF family protein